MTRVSLKEAYDNKDVVAQICAIRDIAEGAEDTANNAVTTANTASEHVDALVPQVEGAVQNANNASASAQASAQTVAGYEDRVTALETADGQNVKLSGDQNITGIKTVSTEATGARSQQIANSAKVGAELDNYTPMVRTTGNQTVGGVKEFTSILNLRTGFNSEAVASEGFNILKVLDRFDNSIQEGSVAFSRNVNAGTEVSRQFMQTIYNGSDYARLSLELLSTGTARVVLYKSINGVTSASTVVTL